MKFGHIKQVDGAEHMTDSEIVNYTKHVRGLNSVKARDVRGLLLYREWHRCGCPYYKVYPGIAAALSDTKLHFAATEVRPPFSCFEVRLPQGWAARAMLVAYSWEAVHFAFHECGYETTVRYTLNKERSIAESLDVEPDKDFRDLCAIAIGVALFGVENHELVLPDLPREVIDKRCRKTKRQRAMERERREREEKKCKGWLVGSEIDLPRPLVLRDRCRVGTGTELQHGHIRSGHMRYQPCGEGGKDRKLIFVAPTVVRPDLPMRQMHGYRIKDRLLAKGTQ